jgi:hypothetical protein
MVVGYFMQDRGLSFDFESLYILSDLCSISVEKYDGAIERVFLYLCCCL